MILKSFHMDGFGIFHDAEAAGLSPGLNLFVGENEAGKSTCLGFLRAMFFGFPDGRMKLNAYPPLAGGNHGGSLALDIPGTGALVMERSHGPRRGRVTVHFPDGGTGGKAEWEALTGGVTEKLFNAVYAVSLHELSLFETLTDEDVKRALFGASMGAGLTALPDALKTLDKRLREDLFKPGGQKPAINRLLAAIEKTNREIQEASGEAREYAEKTRELKKIRAAMEESSQKIRRLREAESVAKNRLALWDDYLAHETARESLSRMEAFPEDFPQRGAERLGEINEALDRMRQDRERLAHGAKLETKKLDALVIDSRILAGRDAIAKLHSRVSAIREARREIRNLGERERAAHGELDRILESLGEGWTRERLGGMRLGLIAGRELSGLATDLGEKRAAWEAAEEARSRAGHELSESEQKVRDCGADLERLGPDDRDWDEALVRELTRGHGRFEGLLRDLEAGKQDLSALEDQFSDTLYEINPQWDRTDLARADTGPAAHEPLETHDRALEDAWARVQTAETVRQAAEKDREQVKAQKELAQKRLEEEPGGPLASEADFQAFRKKVREMRDLHQDAEAHAREAARLSDRQDKIRAGMESARARLGSLSSHATAWAAAALLVSGPILALSTWLSGLSPWNFSASGLVFALGLTLFLSRRAGLGKIQNLREEFDRVRKDLEQEEKAAGEAREAAHALVRDLALTPEGADPDQVEDALDLAREGLVRKKDLRRALDEREAALAERRELLDQARNAEAGAREDLGRAEAAWEAHLASTGLPPGLSPAAARTRLVRAEAAKQALSRLEARGRELNGHEEEIHRYLEKARTIPSLADRLEKDFDGALPWFFERVREAEERAGQRNVLEEKLREAESRLDGNRKKQSAAEAALDLAQKAFEESRASFANWLSENGLPPGLDPEGARAVLEEVRKGRERLEETRPLASNREEREARVKAFEKEARELFQETGRPGPGDGDWESALEALNREAEENWKSSLDRDHILETLEKSEGEANILAQREAEKQKEKEALLARAKAPDEEAFLDRAARYGEYRELVRQAELAETSLLKRGGADSLESVLEGFRGRTRESLEAELAEISHTLSDRESELESLRTLAAEINERLNRLASSDDVGRLRQQREEEAHALDGLSRQWASLALCRHLLNQARARFEKERQPKVIQDAARYFSAITRGRYTEVVAPLGEDELYVASPSRPRKRASTLSRGTAEQLYLCLRLAYVENGPGPEKGLPVVLDDILVNFDEKRARAAAKTLADFAGARQILFFTCHNHMADLIREAAPKAPVFRLSGGRIQPQTL